MIKTKIFPTFLSELQVNLEETPQFVQVVLGPRQVGKTTGILQLLEETKGPSFYFSADDQIAPRPEWIEEKWQEVRLNAPNGLLVIDEIQKVPAWSQTIKKLWDVQKRKKNSSLRLVLLGSSSLEIQTGLSESLAGRFQLISATHWDYKKSSALRPMAIDEFVRFGGYPGSYALLGKPLLWEKYIQNSIIETVIGKDILQIASVQKPALFKQAFEILMAYPAQDISYTKLLGQLQDSGNTDLIKRYIDLYEGAFLLKAVYKYSGRAVLSRSSSPKLVPLCGALINREVLRTKEGYGRAFEAAVGASLINGGFEVFYWRDSKVELDYVVPWNGHLFAIEVKSGRSRSSKGMATFIKHFPRAKAVFVTPENVIKLWENSTAFFNSLS